MADDLRLGIEPPNFVGDEKFIVLCVVLTFSD